MSDYEIIVATFPSVEQVKTLLTLLRSCWRRVGEAGVEGGLVVLVSLTKRVVFVLGGEYLFVWSSCRFTLSSVSRCVGLTFTLKQFKSDVKVITLFTSNRSFT